MTPAAPPKRKVLFVDTLSSVNDFGVELPIALDACSDLTVFTIKGTRLQPQDCQHLIVAFPEFWGKRSKISKILDQFKATVQLARQLWKHRHGVVHVQFFRSLAHELPLYLFMRPFLKQLVCTVHNVLPHESAWWHSPVYRLWYKSLDRIHVLSRHTGEKLVTEYNVPISSIIYAPHGDYARFYAAHPPAHADITRTQLSIKKDECMLLYYGLIRPYKGVDRLIEACAYLKAPNARIVIAGGCSPEVEKIYRDRLAELGLHDRVQFLAGHLSNQYMSDLIAASDVVLFPYHHIYQSGALLMALTYGKPTITSDLRGFREYIEDGRSGVACATENPHEFARQMDLMAQDPQRREQMGDNAVRLTIERYQWPRIAQTIVNAYGL